MTLALVIHPVYQDSPEKMIYQLAELCHFRRFCQGGCRGHAMGNDLCDLIEVPGAYLALVFGRGVSKVLKLELRLLQLRVAGHAMCTVLVRQLEHAVVEGMETGQGDELEPVSHLCQFLLEDGDGLGIELLAPVEGGRAVIGQHLAGKLFVNGFSETACLIQVWF